MSSESDQMRPATTDGLAGRGKVSRRDFLKIGALTGAALGVGGGLTGALAACGSDSGSTRTAAAAAAARSRWASSRRSPARSPLSAIPDPGCVKQWNAAVAGGLECGDGQTHPIKIIVKDTQSDTNRAAQVTGDLITNDGSTSSWCAPRPTPCRRSPTSAEALQMPCVTNDCPWQAYFFGRGGDPAEGFEWTYHAAGASRASRPPSSTCGTRSRPTRRSARCGRTTATALPGRREDRPAAGPQAGRLHHRRRRALQDLTETTPRRSASSSPPTRRSSAASCFPPDFTNFWKQSLQQGFNPIVATVGKALLFPQRSRPSATSATASPPSAGGPRTTRSSPR